jgi:hypothetical protein
MLPLGMIVTFAGYGIGTWGWVLVKGYNISLRQWFSPLHPWQGPLDKAGMVPQGQIFPGKNSTGTAASGSNAQAAPKPHVQAL